MQRPRANEQCPRFAAGWPWTTLRGAVGCSRLLASDPVNASTTHSPFDYPPTPRQRHGAADK